MKELSFEQMECINGGGWLSDAWNWVTEAAGQVWDWITDSLINYFGSKVITYLNYLHDAY